MPDGETGAIVVAATACPVPLVLRNEVVCNGVPAGRADRYPGIVSPTLVTLSASADASAGTPSGSGTVSSPPGASAPAKGPASRVSTSRRDATETKRPARALVAGTNAPVTSTIRSPATFSKSSIVPVAPSWMMAELATGRSGRVLSTDTNGRGVPPGNRVTKPGPAVSGAVTVTETAVAPSGTPGRPVTSTEIVAAS